MVGAFGLSEMAINDIFGVFNAPVSVSASVSVPAPTTPSTSVSVSASEPVPTPHSSAPSAGEEISDESLSSAESDEGDKKLGWILPDDEDEEDEEVPVPTSAPADITIPPPRCSVPAFVLVPKFTPTFGPTFATATIEAGTAAVKHRQNPVLITGRWVRERRSSKKDWIWVPEAGKAECRRDEEEKEDEAKEEVEKMAEEDVRAEAFRMDMMKVEEKGWSWGSSTTPAEGAAAAAAITTTTTTAITEAIDDLPRAEEDTYLVAVPNVGSDLVSISEVGSRRLGYWSIPVRPLFLVLLGVFAWILGVGGYLAGGTFWDGLKAVPDVPAWELVAPLETMLLRLVSEVLPVDTGKTMLALFLSVVFARAHAVVQTHGAAESLSRVFGWAVGAVGGVGVLIGTVMRWKAALAMTTTDGGVAFSPSREVTGVEWEEVGVVSYSVVEEGGEINGWEKSLPIEFVSARDIVPAVDMCPRHELGIGAGTRVSGGGAGGSFGLGLFFLGVVVWGSGGRRMRRRGERR